jgi:hypothetical protein
MPEVRRWPYKTRGIRKHFFLTHAIAMCHYFVDYTTFSMQAPAAETHKATEVALFSLA